jgi:hypothetical protein
MRCQACNKELTDRESGRKDDNTGEFSDLCSKCLSVSSFHAAEVEYDAELLAEMNENVQPRSSRDPLDVFNEMVYDGGYWLSWGDGLGLMTPTARRILLYNKAKDRFLASVNNGDKLNISINYAFNVMPKRNGRGFHEGMSYGFAPEGDNAGQGGAAVETLYSNETVPYEQLV